MLSFMCLLAICISSWRNVYSVLLPIFYLFFFFVVVVVGLHELLIYILNTIGKDPDAGKD